MPNFKHTAEDGKVTLQFLSIEQIEQGRTFVQEPKTNADGEALKDEETGETLYHPKVEGVNWVLGMLKPGSVEVDDDEAELIRADLIEQTRDLNAEARAYLANTDWYVIRKQETGQEIPEEILAKRQAARESVK